MKGLDYYLSQNYKVEVVKDEGEEGYVFSIPALKGCLTCSRDLATGFKLLEDAKREWLSAALEDGYEIQSGESQNNFSGQFKLRIPKSLHKELAERSKQEGVSMNQYCLYLLAKSMRGAKMRVRRGLSVRGGLL